MKDKAALRDSGFDTFLVPRNRQRSQLTHSRSQFSPATPALVVSCMHRTGQAFHPAARRPG